MLVDINGQKYLYSGVTQEDFNRMTYKQEGDISLGKLFNTEIKSKYPFEKLTEDQAKTHKLSEVLSGTQGTFVVASTKGVSFVNSEYLSTKEKHDSPTAKDYVKTLKYYTKDELVKENIERDKLREMMRKTLRKKIESGAYKSGNNVAVLESIESSVDLSNPYLVDVGINAKLIHLDGYSYEGWSVTAKYIYPTEHFQDAPLTFEETRLVEARSESEDVGVTFSFGDRRQVSIYGWHTELWGKGGKEGVYWHSFIDGSEIKDDSDKKELLSIVSSMQNEVLIRPEKDANYDRPSSEKKVPITFPPVETAGYAREYSKMAVGYNVGSNIKSAAKLLSLKKSNIES